MYEFNQIRLQRYAQLITIILHQYYNFVKSPERGFKSPKSLLFSCRQSSKRKKAKAVFALTLYCCPYIISAVTM